MAKKTRGESSVPSDLAIPLPLLLEAGFPRRLPWMGALPAARMV
jgi:hypothetical protein